MNKKKSRGITVDDHDYRWTFFENSGWNDITIQSVSGNGQKLVAQLKWSHSSTPNVYLGTPVTPDTVRKIIQTGLEIGWKPSQSGIPFRAKWKNEKLEKIIPTK